MSKRKHPSPKKPVQLRSVLGESFARNSERFYNCNIKILITRTRRGTECPEFFNEFYYHFEYFFIYIFLQMIRVTSDLLSLTLEVPSPSIFLHGNSRRDYEMISPTLYFNKVRKTFKSLKVPQPRIISNTPIY